MTPQAAAGFAKSLMGAAYGGQDAEVDTGAQVARWRRYGKDRLYVTAADGTKIGWRDLLTGEDHIEAAGRDREFAMAVANWSSGVEHEIRGEAPVSARATALVDLEQEPASPHESQTAPGEQNDLAERLPGTMAREQAMALKQAAPVRTFLARALGVHTDERAWRLGAEGEELVAAQLRRLAKKDPRWRVLHAIPVGENGSDIDHLVIGPGGVFTLNAKHHPRSNVWVGGDTFMVNGRRLPYIRNSRHEATRASRLLTQACGFPVAVQGVVVPVGAASLTIKGVCADMVVVNRMALRNWFRRRAEQVPDEQIAAIYEAARRYETWRARA